MSDVEKFETDFLIALTREQKKSLEETIDCLGVVQAYNIPHETHWVEAAVKKFKTNGWGLIDWDVDEIGFLLNATGMSAGDQAAHSQAPITFRAKIKNVPRSDWIAVVALLISLAGVVFD